MSFRAYVRGGALLARFREEQLPLSPPKFPALFNSGSGNFFVTQRRTET